MTQRYRIRGLQERMDDRNTFDEEIKVPSVLAMAIQTSRPELLALAKKDFNRAETDMLVDTIGTLLKHTIKLSNLCEQLADDLQEAVDNLNDVHETLDKARSQARIELDYTVDD